MTRSETTKFLSRLLEKSRFSGPGKYWAREVSLDYGYAAGKPRRVDYMQFIPENQCSISAIEKGIFACYQKLQRGYLQRKWIKFYWRKKLPCDNNGVLQRDFT